MQSLVIGSAQTVL